jgi:hypothetical protein
VRVSLPFLCIWQPCWPIYILLILFPFEHLFGKSELLSIHQIKRRRKDANGDRVFVNSFGWVREPEKASTVCRQRTGSGPAIFQITGR